MQKKVRKNIKEKKSNRIIPIIAGILVFIAAIAVIFSTRITFHWLPAQEIRQKGDIVSLNGLHRSLVYIQEIRLRKDYLNGIDLMFRNQDQALKNHNSVMILDSSGNLLLRIKLTNEGIPAAPTICSYSFPDKIKAGKGSLLKLCLTSNDGVEGNFLLVTRIPDANDGTLFYKWIIKNDPLLTVQDTFNRIPLNGTLFYRTYESNHNLVWVWRVILVIPALMLALIVCFAGSIKKWILNINYRPDRIYLITGITAGLLLVFSTPPFMVPDEDVHFYRSYQISEGELIRRDSDVPEALLQLTHPFKDMRYNMLEKTSIRGILALDSIRVDPQKRVYAGAPDDIISYLPQSAGIFLARITGLPLLYSLYIGRIMNLLCAISLIWLGIRKAPFGKWIFILAGLMPMSLFLFASLSYTPIRIGAAFLLIALFLDLAFGKKEKIRTIDWIWLFLVIALLGLSKFPYTLLCFLFLLIPVKKAGGIGRYITMAMVTVILLVIVYFAYRTPGSGFVSVFSTPSTESQAVPSTEIDLTKPSPQANPKAQQELVLRNPLKTIGMLFKTTFYYLRPFYLETLIGRFGWLQIYLPDWMINLYLAIFLLAALLISNGSIDLSWKDRLLFLAVFTAGIAMIELAFYITWTAVGYFRVEGVQGRYFIPFLPLILLMFTNNIESLRSRTFIQRLMPFLVVLTVILSSLITLIVIIRRFYEV
jgi:uncharacterized membrane protein